MGVPASGLQYYHVCVCFTMFELWGWFLLHLSWHSWLETIPLS